MEIITVDSLMVPIDEYAQVHQEASVYEAVKALEKAQEMIDHTHFHYLHRSILVVDDDKNIIGKIGQYDVIAALEPKYKEMGEIRNISRAGFNLDFIKSLLDKYALCERPFPESCRNAGEMKVKEVMHTLTEGEYVKSEESLCDAIHQLVLGNHQSLLVVEGKKIAGVLRLTDVFHFVFQTMEQVCKEDWS